jgi:hypothetical protein
MKIILCHLLVFVSGEEGLSHFTKEITMTKA